LSPVPVLKSSARKLLLGEEHLEVGH
jgi:hypothetical protein